MGFKTTLASSGSYKKFKRTSQYFANIAGPTPVIYTCGGYTTNYTNTLEVTKPTTKNSGVYLSVLSLARNGCTGTFGFNYGKGFVVGGYDGTVRATADKAVQGQDLTISAQSSANLSTARALLASFSSDTNGYFLGGDTAGGSANPTVTADKLVYTSDVTSAQSSANLSTARSRCTGSNNRSNVGYVTGGLISGASSTNITDKMPYSTEITAAQSLANLPTISRAHGALNFITASYIMGGYSSDYLDTIVELNFTTGICSLAGKLVTARNSMSAGADISGVGFVLGGQNSGGVISSAELFTLSTRSSKAQTSANLSTGRGAAASIINTGW